MPSYKPKRPSAPKRPAGKPGMKMPNMDAPKWGKLRGASSTRMADMAARMKKYVGKPSTRTAQAMEKSARKDVGKASSSASIKAAGNASALARKKLLAANKMKKAATR